MPNRQKKKRVRRRRPSDRLQPQGSGQSKGSRRPRNLESDKSWGDDPETRTRLPNAISNRVLIGSIVGSILLVAMGIYIAKNGSGSGSGGSGLGSAFGLLQSDQEKAESLLREVENAYRAINSYEDETNITFNLPPDNPMAGTAVTAPTDIRFAFERPNRVRFQLKRGEGKDREFVIDVASDGNSLRSQILPHHDKIHQMVERAAPRQATLASLFSATEVSTVDRPDELMSMLVSIPASLQVSQIALLLASPETNLFDTAFPKDTKKTLLEEATLNGVVCQRVRCDTAIAPLTFWIDKQTKLLRQVAVDENTKSTFQNIKAGHQVSPSAFELKPASDDQLMRHFVWAPNDEINPMLGRPPGPFELTGLDGQPQKSIAFKDKVAVLCWFDSNEASRYALGKLSTAAASMKSLIDKDKVAVLAVCSEPTTRLSHDSVRNLLRRWNIDLPVARDLEPVGIEQFQVPAMPWFVVLDGEGFVQVHETIDSPDFDVELPAIVDSLLAGRNIASDYKAYISDRKKLYQRMVMAARVDAPSGEELEIGVKIAKATLPKNMKLTPLWKCEELAQPGNLLAWTEPNDKVSIAAFNGVNRVAQINSAGVVEKESAIGGMDAASPLTRIDSAVDGDGNRYYVGWSVLGKQLTVFDQNWRQRFVYPQSVRRDNENDNANANESPSINDAHLADLNDDGKLEVYATFTNSRTACLNVQGKVAWTQTTPSPLLSLTSSIDRSRKSFLLGTTASGQIAPIDKDGVLQRPLDVGSRAIHQLVSSNPADACSVYCGLSNLPTGSVQAIGIKGNMQEEWNYVLPRGTFRSQIQNATSITWNGSLCWILAAADGSVHFVAQDGSFHDQFNTGNDLTGLAVYETRGAKVLLLASADGIEAFQMERK